MLGLSFSGSVAIVFGGSSGIGQGIAAGLIKLGAQTIVASRTSPDSEFGGAWIDCDVRSEKDIRKAVAKVKETHQKVDILVNAMGINFSTKAEEITLAEWNDVISTNLTGAFLTIKEVLPLMKRQRSGKIVNVASIAGRHRSIVSGCHYVATKAGMIGLTKQVAFEAAAFNINVNAVCPSQTKTPMLYKTMTEGEIENLEANIPLKRLAEIEDQVEPVLFLCSSGASYITGAVVDVNGGQI